MPKHNKKKIETHALNPKEFSELARASTDLFYFSQFIKVIHPVLGVVQFLLYPFQVQLLYQFIIHKFNVVLKFRQAGVTELISMYCLWFAMYHPHKNIVIISIKDRVAKKVLRKIKFMYDNLPDHLKAQVVNGRGNEIGTSTEMEFSNGSLISSIPTTEDAGRSEAVSLLVIDEAAIVRWADRIWAGLWPTLSTGGRAIVNSCITGDTEIIGRFGNFRIDEICPNQFGVKNIKHLGIQVLSHTGKWQRVLQSINKGSLETWEISNKFGDIIKCTPTHKLLTTNGWKSAKEIIENNNNAIIYNPGLGDLQEPPKTIPPIKEILKPIQGWPNYLISNLGNVYIKKNEKLILKKGSISSTGYYRVTLWDKNDKQKLHIHNLVAKAFIGNIPKGYLVDHINCIPTDNYSTNLQIIPRNKNTQRAIDFSRGMKLGCKIGKGFPNLQLIGIIREKYSIYGKGYGNLDLIINDCQRELGIQVSRTFISRIVNDQRTKTVQISKLKLKRKYIDTIYDIEIEEDHSYITNSNFVNHNTAYGVGNFFHKLYTNAVSGGNKFNAVRLHWQMHPERDDIWYKDQLEILGPRKTAQEIDGDFLTSGNTVFNLADIKAIEDDIADIYQPIETRENGLLKIYKRPVKGENYFLGADISTGRSQDYTTFSIMSRDGDEMVSYKGKIPIDRAEKLMVEFAKKYNRALMAPESNDIGLGLATNLQNHGYANLYYSKSLLRKKGKNKPEEQLIPGWYTTKKNRPIIIANLEEDIRNDIITIKDKAFCDECPTFIYDTRNRPVALNKDKNATDELFADEDVYTDDAIFGKAIVNHIRKQRPNKSVLPR